MTSGPLATGTEASAAGAVYVSRPTRAERPLPSVVVVSDMWGDTEHLRHVSDRIAASGYLAVAPDLYDSPERPDALSRRRVAAAREWIDGLEADMWTHAGHRKKALAAEGDAGRPLEETLDLLFEGPRDPERFRAVLEGAVNLSLSHPSSDGRSVGAVGFCLGGGLVGRLACTDARLRAAVVFYGAPPPDDMVAAGHCPVLGLYGGADQPITSAVPGFADAMGAAGRRFEHHVFAGAPHAFFNESRRAYRVDAARRAWVLTLTFLSHELAGQAP